MENLPNAHESHDQERTSALRFELLVPKDLFLVREENGGDYGVDRILELRKNSKYVSNVRSHVQLKSLKSTNRNNDLSVSYPVSINNINYLMNQNFSLYIIYLSDEEKFLWDWVVNIYYSCLDSNIDVTTTDQEKFSYRFSNELDKKAFEEIHVGILEKSAFLRTISEKRLYLRTTDASSIIYVEKGNITDIETISKILKKDGLNLLYLGDASLVSSLSNMLPSIYKNDPNLSFIISYAKLLNGEIFESYSWLPKGNSRQSLSDEEIFLVNYINICLDYTVGRISSGEYDQHISELISMNSNSILSLQIMLNSLVNDSAFYYYSIQEDNYDQIEQISLSILNHIDANDQIRNRITSLLWRIEGHIINSNTFQYLEMCTVIRELNIKVPDYYHQYYSNEIYIGANSWERQYKELLRRPNINKTEMILSNAHVRLSYCSFIYMLNDNIIDKESESQLKTIFNELNKCINEMGTQFGKLELYCRIIQAEILYVLGDEKKALEITKEVNEIAVQQAYDPLIERCSELLKGQTLFPQKTIDTEFEYTENIKEAVNVNLGLQSQFALENLLWGTEEKTGEYEYCIHSVVEERVMPCEDGELLRRIRCSALEIRSFPKVSNMQNSMYEEFEVRYCRGCTLKES